MIGLEQERPEDPVESMAEDTPTPETAQGAIVEIRKIPDLPKGFYNAAAWKANGEPDSPTLLLGRQPEKPGARGKPDTGSLQLVVLNKDNEVVSIKEMWRPEGLREGDQLEDVRAIVTPNGDVILGCTRLVFNSIADMYEPFPAVAITSSEALLRGEFPDTNLIEIFGSGRQTTPIGNGANRFHLLPGKNATPLEPNKFMFRREGDSHRMTVFSRDEVGRVKELPALVFPKNQIPAWGADMIGTTMPPVWLDKTKKEALFLPHGFKLVEGKPKYALGSARLFFGEDGEYAVDNISEEPLLTPEMLAALFPGEQVQLHPELRDALYMSGGTPVFDSTGNLERVYGYPSVGDSRTLEAIINVHEITRNWKRPELAAAA